MIIIIALVTQVTRLTRRMRRVRTTLDLKMSKKKKAREDNTEYNAMDDRIRNDVHNPYDLYTPNQERNRKDIENIRSDIGMLTKKQGKQEVTPNVGTQNMLLKTQAVHPLRVVSLPNIQN